MILLLLNIAMELNIHKAFRNGTRAHSINVNVHIYICIYIYIYIYIHIYICEWLLLLVQFKWWKDGKIEFLGALKDTFHLVEMLAQWIIMLRHYNKPGFGQRIQKLPFSLYCLLSILQSGKFICKLNKILLHGCGIKG